MSKTIKTWMAIAAPLALFFLIIQHAFRVELEDNPALGLFEYTYRWWKPREVALDSNRDGSIDAKGILVKEANDFRDPFQEYWEDSDFDQHFEIHVVFERGQINLIEFDENRDGIYERKIVGEEAVSFFTNRAAAGSGLSLNLRGLQPASRNGVAFPPRYEGRDGWISARQTRASFGLAHYAFLTEFEWDRQGNLDLLSYPRCLTLPASATTWPGTSTSPTSSVF